MADDSHLWLPTEFPYDYHSLHSSTHSHDSLPELTRLFSHSSLNTTTHLHLQKSPLFFASQESTLNRGVVALRNDGVLGFNHRTAPALQHPSLFIKPSHHHRCFYSTLPHNNNINHVKQARITRPRHQMGNNFDFPLHIQKNCFTLNHPQIYTEFHQNPDFVGGCYYNGARKNPSAGTGVFLPRKYSNPTESRKKAGQVSRGRVSQALETNNIPMVTHFQPQTRSCFNDGFSLQYDN